MEWFKKVYEDGFFWDRPDPEGNYCSAGAALAEIATLQQRIAALEAELQAAKLSDKRTNVLLTFARTQLEQMQREALQQWQPVADGPCWLGPTELVVEGDVLHVESDWGYVELPADLRLCRLATG